MTHDNKLQVEAIKRGTVIDHIPAQIGFKLLSLFKLTETDQRITIGLNLPSGEMGRKDLIKIENTFLRLISWRYMHRKPRLTVSTTMKWLANRAPVCQSASTMCWSARTATVSAMPNRFHPALPCENAPMISRSNANTVKKSFPIMWCWPINCGW